MRGGTGHELAAGAIGGSAIVAGAAAGPLWAAVFELVSATVTAGIAAHAVDQIARAGTVSAQRLLPRVARRAAKVADAPLAAHALDAACRARAGDPRALRSAAMLVGRVTAGHARGIALQIASAWCAPFRQLTKLGAPVVAARAALDGAEFVRAMKSAALEHVAPAAALEVFESAPPESGRFAVGTFSETAVTQATQHAESDWEAAA